MNQKDLTKGSVFPTMCLFAMPMILGNVLQQGYNVADTWVVGHYIGSDALAAVGSAFALMTCLTSVLLGLCMGSGVVFSLCFGKQDERRLENSICASFLLASLIAAILTAGSLLGVDGIIRWMNIPQEITGITKDYLVFIFCGIPAVALYNFFGAYLKALGNSVVPLVFLGISTVLNIGLDIWFIAVLKQGTVGAAAATILSQYISGIGIGLYAIIKNKTLRNAFCHFKIKASSLFEITNYSLLTCLQQSVMNFGILIVQGLVNTFGITVMAGYAAALLLWFLAKPLMEVFVEEGEAAIVAEGVRFLHTVGPFYFGIGCLFLFYGIYRAVGKPGMSVVLTVISLGIRVGLAYTLANIPSIGVAGIWWSIPIGWGIADLTGALYFMKHRGRF